MRQLAFYVFTGADKVLSVVVVLFNTGSDGKMLGSKMTFRREADLKRGEDFIGAAIRFALAGIAWPTSSKAMTTIAAP